jgi:hypothetical protein
MGTLAIVLLCALPCSVSGSAAEEPRQLAAEEVEKELAIVEAYLTRDLAASPQVFEPGELSAATSAATKVVGSVGGLPEESPARLKAIALARRYSAIPEYATEADLRQQQRADGVDHRQAHARLYFAWGVLQETGVLRG